MTTAEERRARARDIEARADELSAHPERSSLSGARLAERITELRTLAAWRFRQALDIEARTDELLDELLDEERP